MEDKLFDNIDLIIGVGFGQKTQKNPVKSLKILMLWVNFTFLTTKIMAKVLPGVAWGISKLFKTFLIGRLNWIPRCLV